MALKGSWIGYDDMESPKGRHYIIASIEYKGKPWERLSTFDSGIIDVAKKLNEGDDVEFETRKSGNFTNLTMLNGVTASGQQRRTKEPKQQSFMKNSDGREKDIEAAVLFKGAIEIVASGHRIEEAKGVVEVLWKWAHEMVAEKKDD